MKETKTAAYDVFTKNDTGKKLIYALVSLMQDNDLSRITVADLTKEANIPRTSFYRRYDSIQSFIDEIEEVMLDTIWDLSRNMISANISPENFDVVDKVSLEPLKFMYSIKELYLAITSEHGDPSYRTREQEMVRNLYGSRIKMHSETPREFDVYMCYSLAGYSAVLDYWFSQRPEITPEEMCIILQRLMLCIYL